MSQLKVSVVVFPGSNCDHDAWFASSLLPGAKVQMVWHKADAIPADTSLVILPGGFSYGDYLRCGAIARFSPVMKSVISHAAKGGLVIGICNGFQILTETGLLPGVLLQNASLSFVCKDVWLKVENTSTPFTCLCQPDSVLRVPVAHGDGNYFASDEVISSLEANDQVIFRYSESDGRVTDRANPNGSMNNIAGIANADFNVLGMMPHPERYSDKTVGGNNGFSIFQSISAYFTSLHIQDYVPA